MTLADNPEPVHLSDIRELRNELDRLRTENNMLIDARRHDARDYKTAEQHNSALWVEIEAVKGTLTTLTHEKEALEAKVVVMGEALADLKNQVDRFCETEGEADFYTGKAIDALSNLPDRVKALQNLVKASKALDDALEFTPEMFFRNKAFQESITEPIHEAVRAYVGKE